MPLRRTRTFGLPQRPALPVLQPARFALAVLTLLATLWGGRAAAPIPVAGGERADSQAKGMISVRGGNPGAGGDRLEFNYGDPAFARAHYWWGAPPREVLARGLRPGGRSNIYKKDYAGPEACRECHQSNYNKWQTHSHRLMNALATPENVKGDFSDRQVMDYLGGKARFYHDKGTNYMRLDRDQVTRIYSVIRTIGSRFFQYYVGRLVTGPEAADHATRREDHVLPLGYLLEHKQWMPIVHIDEEKPDGERFDAFAKPTDIPYDRSCSYCHTTWPAGDWLMSSAGLPRAQYYSPFRLDFHASGYLQAAHPDTLAKLAEAKVPREDLLEASFREIAAKPIADHGVALGITCEVCHNGAKAHAENSTRDRTDLRPMFFPAGPELSVQAGTRSAAWGRRAHNLNWSCARCHSGGRKSYAAGMSVWNAVEFSDAEGGGCYPRSPAPAAHDSQPALTCVHCHSPHQGIGRKWSRTPVEDDQSCLACHQKYADPPARLAHTHHLAGSPGENCMNCHMPKINEGLHDVVRTHRIFSPTEPRMIEANHPNACNLCHLNENIDWTIGHLKKWYPGSAGPYAEAALKANYPDRSGPVGLGWLKSPHEHTRLVAAEALAKADSRWALPELLDTLDDPFLINRRFSEVRLNEMLGTDLRDQGYHFFQLGPERQEPLRRIRAQFARPKSAEPAR